ncbi:MAG: tetratricopeptide repeat protein [Myxococcota bacterium]
MNTSASRSLLARALTALALSFPLLPGVVAAQDADVVGLLRDHGRMGRNDAVATVEAVDEVMKRNAAEGGDGFDALRRKTHRALFGDDPVTPRNLPAVLERLEAGLDVATLQVFFARGRHDVVLCAANFALRTQQCDSLIAAATETRMGSPFPRPDNGAGFERSLRRANVDRTAAASIVERARTVTTGVPAVVTRDDRGRAILRMLAACPGGTEGRLAQFRQWNLGPTATLMQCVARDIVAHGRIGEAEAVFALTEEQALAFLSWGAPREADALMAEVRGRPAPGAGGAPAEGTASAEPGEGAEPAATTPPPVTQPEVTGGGNTEMSAESLRSLGRAQFRAGNYADARTLYQQASEREPEHAGTWAAIGNASSQLRDYAVAAEAFAKAVAIEGDNVDFRISLGRAQADNGDTEEAIATLVAALGVDPYNRIAREGIRALGGEPPPPPLPQLPERHQIVATMSPLRDALRDCSPTFRGPITFQVIIEGPTGSVMFSRGDAEQISEEEGQCMDGVVQGAQFPRFQQETLEIYYPYEL